MDKYIYYCKNCDSVYSGAKDTIQKCPECKVIIVPTMVELEEWRSKTPEEKEELKEHFKTLSVSNSSEHRNKIGNILNAIGYIDATLCLISALIIAIETNIVFAFVWFICAVLGAIFIIAFGEVINLLQDIKNK